MSDVERGRSTAQKPLTPSPRRSVADVSMSPPGSPVNGVKPATGVIVVTGLSKNVLTPHLEEIFGVYGRVTGLDLPVFKVSGLNRGKAAIEFDRPADAEEAVRCMDGGVLDGSVLRVEISAHPLPPPRPPTPPPRSRSPPPFAGADQEATPPTGAHHPRTAAHHPPSGAPPRPGAGDDPPPPSVGDPPPLEADSAALPPRTDLVRAAVSEVVDVVDSAALLEGGCDPALPLSGLCARREEPESEPESAQEEEEFLGQSESEQEQDEESQSAEESCAEEAVGVAGLWSELEPESESESPRWGREVGVAVEVEVCVAEEEWGESGEGGAEER